MLISDFLKQNLWLDSTKSNAFSGTIEAGKVLHIEGLEKSTVVDGDVDETDMALNPALSPEHGWVMPVNTNAFRKIQLRTDVGLPGIHVLTLSGSGVRVWQSPHPATGDTPLLVAGQTVTNGVAGISWNTASTDTVYIEAYTSGTSILTYAFVGTGSASGIVSRALLKITIPQITLFPKKNLQPAADM